MGGELGVFIGGFCVGIISNIFARLVKRPGSIFLIPGIILLVPGSIGYRSITFLFEKNAIQGVESAFSMFVVALSLVTGLLLGHLFVDPKRSF